MRTLLRLVISSLIAIMLFVISQHNFAAEKNYGSRSIYFESCGINLDQERKANLIRNYNIWRPSIGIAMSGGGARGVAQAGVLKQLMVSGLEADYIVGTSIGSVVAGLYATGYLPDEIDSILRAANWEEILTFSDSQGRDDYFLDQKIIRDRNLITLRFKDFKFVVPEAISEGSKFTVFLQRYIWNGLYHDNGNFNNLKIPFRAVTSDLISGETVVLDSGNLITALRASSSFPLRYSPVRVGDMLLVDGGLMANLPTKALYEFNPDMIIGVNTISPLMKSKDLDKPWNIADQVVSILMKRFSDTAEINADIIIKPEIGDHSNTNFKDLDFLLRAGEFGAQAAIKEIKEVYDAKAELKLINELMDVPEKFDKVSVSGFNSTDSVAITALNMGNPIGKKDLAEKLKPIMAADRYKELQYKEEEINGLITLTLEAVIYKDIKDVKITGLKDSSMLDLYNLNGDAHIDKKLKPSDVEYISESILKELRRSGYSFVDISNIEFNNESGEITFALNERLIDSISFVGDHSNDFLILRELTFKEGEAADANKIIDSWENIVSLDFISDVEMNWTRDSSSGINVSISAKEIGDQTIRLGSRVDNERFTQAGIEMIQENLFDQGSRLSLRFAGGLRNQYYLLKAENTRIFNSYYTSSYSAYYDIKDRYVYERLNLNNRKRFDYARESEISEERYGVRAMLGTQIEKKGAVSGELRYEKQRYYDIGSSIKPDYYSLFTIKIGTVFDTEDKSDFATEGRVINLSLETSLLSSPDAISFSKAEFLYRTNFSYQRHSIRPSLFFGFSDESSPLPEFFDLGGQENFFGMRENQFRGRQLARGSLEYSFKSPYYLFFDTYLSFRYDIGSAWEKFGTIKFEDLRHGAGVTLGFDTPVGHAKFSLGRSFILLRNPNSVSLGPILGYFSIGLRL